MAGKILPRDQAGRYISNDEARSFLIDADAYLANTGTLWCSLCKIVGVSQSLRSSIRSDGNRMQRAVRDRFLAVMAENPKGVLVNLVRDRQHLPEAETAVLVDEIKQYLERTGTIPVLLAKAGGREESTLTRLLENPARISASLAARYRRVMFNYPDGIPLSTFRRRVSAPVDSLSTDRLLERCGEAERMRNERYAAIAAEHRRKYGKPIGPAPWEMAA